jgi:hypothetical protein
MKMQMTSTAAEVQHLARVAGGGGAILLEHRRQLAQCRRADALPDAVVLQGTATTNKLQPAIVATAGFDIGDSVQRCLLELGA